MRIVFIGLGNMGGPMALNLARSGHDLTVFDLDPEKGKPILEQGAAWTDNLPESLKTAEIVMTSLPGPEQIETTAFGELGLLSTMSAGAVWIELSTNNLEVEQKVRKTADKRGIEMLDAPVSGGIEGAANGSLTIMVGGNQEVYERCLSVLKIIGENVVYLGKHGAGYVGKIAQVVLCYLHSVALSEALMLGTKGGVDPQSMLSIIQNSTGRSYVSDRYGPAILKGDYDPGFTLGLAHKDMRLTIDLAKSVGAELPMCQQVEAVYGEACESFGKEQNHLMAVRLLEEANQTYLRAK